MKVLIIGYGSIGSRHARLLKELGCQVSVVSQRDIEVKNHYKSIAQALDKENPEYVVISTCTEDHYSTFSELAALGFTGIVLVEKPLFNFFKKPPAHQFKRVYVAYNLRFHPLIQKLRSVLAGERIVSAQTMVGLYLPLWQPQRDYRLGYSARKLGGGALRDLSHEIDYSTWLFGEWQRVVAIGGHFSALEIESDDVFSLMMVTKTCPMLTVHVNYLDRLFRREILVNTDRHTIKVDLIGQYFQVDHDIEKITVDRDDTYLAQHRAILRGDSDTLCTLEEGLDMMRLIDSAECSSREQKWVTK